MALSFAVARADDVQYVYDALGRLVQATNLTSGQAVEYTYDAAGNITSQTAVSLSTLSVGNVSSADAPVGSQITINGTGFSTTAANDVVTFNGTPATVVSATSTQLVVTVPAGATSGAVSVQVGTSSVSAAGTFTVAANPIGPAITALYPAVGTAGELVTISGVNFDPTPGNNNVRFNVTAASVAQSSATSILTSVPANTGSGKIQVMTPSGIAVSPMDFIVVPSGYSASSIASTGRLPTDGSLTSITLATASKVSVQLFDGNAGDLLTIGVGSTSLASVTLKVFKPDGTSLTSGTVTAAGQGVQLPKLPKSGTYTIVIDPGTNTGSISLSLNKPLQAMLTLNGSADTVTIAPPGRRALLTFTGAQGTYVSVSLSAVTLSAGTLSVIAPNGAVLESTTFGTSGVSLQPALSQNGTYTVLIDPTGSVGGSLTVALASANSTTLGINQSTNVSLPNTTPVSVTYDATAGQYLSLGISENSSQVSGATIKVVKPDGTTLTTGTFTATSSTGCNLNGSYYCGSSVINLGAMPIGGTYTVIVQQTGSGSGTITLTLSTPVTSALTIGSSSSVTATLTGQAMQLTFSAAAGQYVSLGMGENGSNIAGATLTVLNPDGSQLQTGAFSPAACGSGPTCVGPTGSGVLNLGPLLTDGTYTVMVLQTTGGNGTITFTPSNPVQQSLAVGASTNVAAPLQGEAMQLTFTGAAGQYLALSIVENQDLIAGGAVVVFNPDGSPLTSGTFAMTYCSAGSPNCPASNYSGVALVNLGPLPADGTYTVLILQASSNLAQSNVGTGTLTFTLSSAVTDTLTAGASQTEQAALYGQPLQLTFAGTSGQYLSLGIVESESGVPGALITVLKPDGSVYTTGTFTATGCTGNFCLNYSGNLVMNMGQLPATGIYTVLVQQAGVGSGALTLTLANPVTAALTPGSSSSTTASLPGQSMEESFSGTTGQYFGLTIGENSDNIAGATLTVLNPDGSTLTTATLTTTNSCVGPFGCLSATGTAFIPIGPLPTTGTYTVLVQQTQTYAGTGTLAFTLSSPADGGVLSPGTPLSLSTAVPGQGMQVEFSGTAGSSVDLHIEEDSGSNISGAAITVLNPDGTPLSKGTLNTTPCSGCGYTGSVDLYPSVLPQTGTYRIVAQQKSAGTGTLTFTANGVQPPTSSTNTYSTSTAGQTVSFTFAATAGQSMSLAITNLVLTPSSPNDVLVTIYNPDGSSLYTWTCNVSACDIATYSLPQTGTYNVLVKPANATQTMSFTATLAAAATATLTLNTPTAVNLNLMGQEALLSFAASAGQTVALNASGITSTPANTAYQINVMNSSGGTVASANTSSSTTINLQNLAADTYRVLIYPEPPATASMQVTLEAPVTETVATDGSSSSVSLPAGQNGYFTFTGTAGTSYNLALTGLTTSPSGATIGVRIINPDGTTFTSGYSCSSFTPSSATCDISGLPQSGTYTVVLSPPATTSASFTVVLSADQIGTLTPGTPVTYTTAIAGQDAIYSFAGQASQRVTFVYQNNTIPSGTIYIFNPDGSLLVNTTNFSSTGNSYLPLTLPATGTYVIKIFADNSSTGQVTINVAPDVTGSVQTNGTPLSLSMTTGQAADLTFVGTAGRGYSLALTGLGTTPSGGGLALSFTAPDGSTFTSAYSCGSWNVSSGNCDISPLPLTGTYTVRLVPYGMYATSFNVVLSQDQSGSVSIGGGQTTFSTAIPGQNGEYSFLGQAGQRATLVWQGNTIQSGTIYVYNSSGAVLANTSSFNGASSGFLDLNLATTDTYVVRIFVDGTSTGHLNFSVIPDVTGTVPTDGTGIPVTLTTAQKADFTFSGTAGVSYGIALTNISTTPGGASIAISLTAPDGTTFTSSNNCTSFTATSGNCDISALPESGAYKVRLVPSGMTAASFTLYLPQTANEGALTANGPAVTFSTDAPGQNSTFTFAGTAGQNLSLAYSANTIAAGSVWVLNPNGTVLADRSYGGTTSGTLTLPSLPSTGNYTIFLFADGVSTGEIAVQLQSR